MTPFSWNLCKTRRWMTRWEFPDWTIWKGRSSATCVSLLQPRCLRFLLLRRKSMSKNAISGSPAVSLKCKPPSVHFVQQSKQEESNESNESAQTARSSLQQNTSPSHPELAAERQLVQCHPTIYVIVGTQKTRVKSQVDVELESLLIARRNTSDLEEKQKLGRRR